MKLAMGVLVSILVAPCVMADVAVDPAYWIGSRSSAPGGGIVATDGWATSESTVPSNFTLAWNISQVGSNFHYVYTIDVKNKDLSHWILQVSEGFKLANIWNYSALPELGTYSSSDGNSNPNMPAALYGLKWDLTGKTATIMFDSDRAPVWGNFYAKDGQASGVRVTAWNAGFLVDPPTDPYTNWIARPDSVTSVPDGGVTLMLLGGVLVGFGTLRRRLGA